MDRSVRTRRKFETLVLPTPAAVSKSTQRARKPRRQFAALPYRGDAAIEVLLVTSRDTGRWVLPKGWPMPGKSGWAAAAQEAREEAGVIGEISKASLGSYAYVKYLRSGRGLACKVKVFPLRATGQLDDWRERGQRSTQWFAWEEAAGAVHELRLARLIRRFAERRESERAGAAQPDTPLALTQETSSPSALPTA
jgi:8-oxo-dGTP pyrophosphatase MutT (NUDIX family)